ncbi:hypothetical protein MPL3365_210088 [Mesorhizobium plurifarium]|uniref:Uncharacterized protein n=1 Tax=Mesorhizobium plurifarium TaxID=69974 RepID=A0A090GUB0_MESPL|nr:hypothetical protein MPL3365_210088 [Mesorhizobium plurifarium]
MQQLREKVVCRCWRSPFIASARLLTVTCEGGGQPIDLGCRFAGVPICRFLIASMTNLSSLNAPNVGIPLFGMAHGSRSLPLSDAQVAKKRCGLDILISCASSRSTCA